MNPLRALASNESYRSAHKRLAQDTDVRASLVALLDITKAGMLASLHCTVKALTTFPFCRVDGTCATPIDGPIHGAAR